MSGSFLHNLAMAVFLTAASGRVSAAVLVQTRAEGGHWQIWTSELDGKNSRRVTSSSWDKRSLRPGLTKSEVLFRNNEGRLYRLDVTRFGNGNEVPVEVDIDVIKDFDFHPSAGFLIASYAPNALDNVCIWHVSADGKTKQLVIPDPYLNETPRWLDAGDGFVFAKSHAGRSLLFQSKYPNAQSSALLKQEFRVASDPAPSPDGKQVVFCGRIGADTELWMASLEQGDAHVVPSDRGMKAEPAWSPDGAWIYFTHWDGRNFRVARVKPTGREFEMVSPAGTDSRCPIVLSIREGNP